MTNQTRGNTFIGAISGLALLALTSYPICRPDVCLNAAYKIKGEAISTYQTMMDRINPPAPKVWNEGENYLKSGSTLAYINGSGKIVVEKR